MAKNTSSRAWQSAKMQRGAYAAECHYAHVEEIAKEALSKEKRTKRLDAIFRLGIKKGGVFKIKDCEYPIKRITGEGMIILENWDEVDPLEIEQKSGA